MSSPIATPKQVDSKKYVPVHKRSLSSTSVSDANKRPPVYSIAELLQLSESPLVRTSLTSEQKQGIIDVMAYIPQPRRQMNSRSPSPAKSGRSSSPTATKPKRASSTKKAKKSPASETISLPKADTPPSPRRRSSKRRPAEANTNTNTSADSAHQHRRRQWGYAPSLRHNEDNWRAHSSIAIAA